MAEFADHANRDSPQCWPGRRPGGQANTALDRVKGNKRVVRAGLHADVAAGRVPVEALIRQRGQRGEGRRPPNRLGSQPIVIVAAYCAGAADEGTAGPVRRRAGRAMMKIIGTR